MFTHEPKRQAEHACQLAMQDGQWPMARAPSPVTSIFKPATEHLENKPGETELAPSSNNNNGFFVKTKTKTKQNKNKKQAKYKTTPELEVAVICYSRDLGACCLQSAIE